LCTALSTPIQGKRLPQAADSQSAPLFNTLFVGNWRGFLDIPPHRRAFNTLFAGNRAQLPNFLLLQHLLPSHLFRTRISLCCI
jgi:hypothetical protein